MKCSNLNGHLYLLHVINSPACSCGHDVENCDHYLLHCPRYNVMRNRMSTSIAQIIPDIILDTNVLLYGVQNLSLKENEGIVNILHAYIKETARFV